MFPKSPRKRDGAEPSSPGGEELLSAFLTCRPVLAARLRRMVKPHDVEDILQDAFLRSYEASKRRAIRHPRSFLFKTATNLAINHINKADNKRTSHVEDFAFVDVSTEDGPESELDTEIRLLAFCRAVARLPRQCQRVFLLKKVYGLSQQEIADTLGISESTVEKHIAKGLLMCREYMEAADVSDRTRPSMRATDEGL